MANILDKKLSFCSTPLAVHQSDTEKRYRRRYVQEISHLLSSAIKTEQLINPRLERIIAMVEASLFRPLKKLTSFSKLGNETVDNAEPDQLEDPTWTVVSPVYNLLKRLLESDSVNQKTLKTLITCYFIEKFIELFDSEYPPEREALKSCLHLMYLKLVAIRKVVRKTINDLLYRLIHEDYRFNGVSELLEILASIISGFAVPIKEEHMTFFERAILPLHKVQTSQLFHRELMRCTMLFVQKDQRLGLQVLECLNKAWPKSNSAKQIAFMEELMMVSCIMEPSILQGHIQMLFRRLSSMLASPHFRVCDFALSCFEKRDLMALVENYKAQIFSILVPTVSKASQVHWQSTISSSLSGLLMMLHDLDPVLFSDCQAKPVTPCEDFTSDSETRLHKEKIWTQLCLEALRNLPDFNFSPEPYRKDHLIGEFNGLYNTHAITPEIS